MPVNRAPVSIIRRAVGRPTRATTKGAICAGGMPSIVSVRENFASSVPRITSPQHIRPSPPAIAAPSTIQITTCGISFIASMTSPILRFMAATSVWVTPGACMALKLFKSPPEQKMPFLPRRVIPRILRSSRTASMTAKRSVIMASPIAFLFFGLSSQRVNHPPLCSV